MKEEKQKKREADLGNDPVGPLLVRLALPTICAQVVNLLAKWKAWKAAGALTSEMETAALFIVSQVLHVRCGAVLNVLWNADNDDAPAIPPDAAERGVKTAVEALRILIREDGAKA